MFAHRLERLVAVATSAAFFVLLASSLMAQEAKVTTVDGKTVVVYSADGADRTVISGGAPSVIVAPPSMPPGGPKPAPGEKKDEDEKKEEGSEEDKSKPDARKGKPGEKEEKKEGEAPKPIERESTPPGPPTPEKLDFRPDKEGKLQFFNFANQPWPAVLQWLADISEMSLDWQELPGDYLNLTTQREYTVRETRDLVNRHLLARGYTMLQQEEVLSVVKIDKINPAMVPRVTPEALDERDPHEYVKVSFPLDWLMAEDMVDELKTMLSPNGKLTALKTTNRMEAMDAVENLIEVRDLLAEEQSVESEDRLIQVFELKHTRAEDVVEQLQSLLGIEAKKSSPGPMTPDQMRAQQEAAKRAAEMAKQGKAPPQKAKPEIYLVADKRHNTILANAPPDKMAIIAAAIEAIDVPTGRTQTLAVNMLRMNIYRLQSIEPEALIKTLEELGDLDFQTRLEADDENNAIIAYAPLGDHVTIQTLVDKLDRGGRRAEVIQLVQLRAESVAKVIDFMMGGGKEEEQDQSRSGRSYFPFFMPYGRSSSRRGSDQHEDQFRVDADVKNNTLLLWCNEFELAKVQKLLDNLRQNQRIGEDPNTVKVHRLVSLDPEAFVKTLEQMEVLDFHTTLEVDEENNSIIAYASEADHAKIEELIQELDGSSREFHVIQLRRLDAEYVGGTIAFMMAGKEDKQGSTGYSRTYVYNEYYGTSPSRGKEKVPDEFRVDADLEYNRLLLWANEIEVKEVQNLLVKLGEIPPEGGDPSAVRVLDVLPGPERDRLLEQIRRAWPSIAPNELLLPLEEESGEEEKKEKAKEEESKEGQPATEAPVANGADGERPVFRFAQLEQPVTEGAQATADQQSPQTPVITEDEPGGDGENVEQDAEDLQGDGNEVADGADEGPRSSGDVGRGPSAGPPKPGETASEATGERPGRLPPISISQSPDGRLVISSEDTQALDRLEDLIAQLVPPHKDYKVFTLKYAEAFWVALNLEDFFEEAKSGASTDDVWWAGWYGMPVSSSDSGGSRRLSRRRPLRFISDDQTNTILVQGASPAQLRTIEELILLYDQPPASDSESARRTEVFQIRYSKADVVAEAVKEVYRDLLSERDKSLADKGQKERQERSGYSYSYFYGRGGTDGEGEERKMPRWKGYLSIGVDTLSNTLIVCAPEFLLRDVERLIEDLDEAAKPTDTVRVVQLNRGVSAEGMQYMLSKVLSEAAAARKTGAKPAGPKPGEGRPTTSGGQGRPD